MYLKNEMSKHLKKFSNILMTFHFFKFEFSKSVPLKDCFYQTRKLVKLRLTMTWKKVCLTKR